MAVKKSLPENPSKILVVDLAMIGDLVCSIPALNAISLRFPRAEISVLASESSLQILKHLPVVANAIPVNKKRVFSNPGAFFSKVKQLRTAKFDVAFLFHNSIGSAILASAARIPHRIGYATEMRSNLLTLPIAAPQERLHLVEARTSLLRRAGIEASTFAPSFELKGDQVQEICERVLPELDTSRKLVLVAVGSTWPTKIWPKERVKALLNKLPVGSCSVGLIGGPGEEHLAEGLSSLSVPIYNLAGKTTLEELIHLIGRCDLLITPDNGPMHIAEALGKPVIGLFGPTDPKLCGMLHDKAIHIQPNSPCICCWEKKCKYKSFCMNEIGEQEVLDFALRILNEIPPNTSGEVL